MATIRVLLLVAAVVTAVSGHRSPLRYDDDDDDRAVTVNNILWTSGWRWTYDDSFNMAGQRVLVDGILTSFADIVGHPPRVDANNVRATSAAMYVTFGCKCAETMVGIAGAAARQPFETVEETQDFLIRFNGTVSKAVSALVDLADVALVHAEPGALNVALLFNFYVNRLIGPLAADNENVTFVLYQLTNVAERYVVSNCSPDDVKRAPSVETFDRLLDNVGLWTANHSRYHVGDGGPWDDVSSRVLTGLQLAVDVRTLKAARTDDLESFYMHQKSILDLILTIVYRNTAYNLNTYDGSKTAVDNYFDCGNDDVTGCDGLIRIYQDLLIKSRLLKFPSDFTNHVGLILRLLEDVRAYGAISDLDVVRKKIDEDLRAFVSVGPNVKAEKYIFESAITGDQSFFTEKGLKLHTFLERVLSVESFEPFNRIFFALGVDLPQSDGERDFNAILNLNAVTPLNKAHSCSAIRSLYAHCFDVEVAVNRCSTEKCLADLKKNFIAMLSILDATIAFERSRNANGTSVLNRAHLYLSYNLVNYPVGRGSGNVRQKLLRIAFHVTNSADRYQTYNWFDCKPLRSDRDFLYNTFAKDTDEKKKYLDVFTETRRSLFGKKKFAFDEKKPKRGFNDEFLRKTLVDKLGEYKSVRVYRRGELKTFVEVCYYVINNIFDISMLPKYTDAISKWATSVFLYATIDLLNCILLTDKNTNKSLNSVAKMYKENLRRVDVPVECSAILATIADVLSFDYRSLNVFGLINNVEEYLEKYDFVVQNESTEGNIDVHVKKLKKILDKLTQIWPKQ